MTEFGPVLLQSGLAGAMLLWFALENSKRMKAMEASVDRLAKVGLLQLISIGHLDKSIKDPANALYDELRAKERPA